VSAQKFVDEGIQTLKGVVSIDGMVLIYVTHTFKRNLILNQSQRQNSTILVMHIVVPCSVNEQERVALEIANSG